jgi:hypothetical protein
MKRFLEVYREGRVDTIGNVWRGPLRNKDLFQQILSCHAHLMKANERTSEDTRNTVLNRHNMGGTTLKHRHI